MRTGLCLCGSGDHAHRGAGLDRTGEALWLENRQEYDNVDGKYLYNRCHLLGFQLTGENANEENLITGTRYLNVEGMLPFENLVADYVKETENHVLYRVTPVFQGMSWWPGGGDGGFLCGGPGGGVYFHVYCYNNQPGISIDYATGRAAWPRSRRERGRVRDRGRPTS